VTDETAASRMAWDPSAERILRALVDMVPDTLRELARATARDESELAAQDRGGSSVETDDVIRGWIRTTPPEQRDGLVEVIDGLGFEPEQFADDLQSLEGWETEEEE
jgi:hypothetical protein